MTRCTPIAYAKNPLIQSKDLIVALKTLSGQFLEQILPVSYLHQSTNIMNTKNHTLYAKDAILILKSIAKWMFIPLLVLLISCSKDQEVVTPDIAEVPPEPTGYEEVDEALWDYFDRFELEASARGIVIDLRSEEVTAEISEIDSRNVAGRCNYNHRNPNKVTIDLSFWRRSGDRSREFVVFHELGHCILYRGHKEDANAFNVCESIMRSGTGDCFDNYNRTTRREYLDELFDERYRGDIFFASVEQ